MVLAQIEYRLFDKGEKTDSFCWRSFIKIRQSGAIHVIAN